MRTADSILAAALTAALARIDGVFDDPALIAFGPLSTSVDDDIEDILTRGIDQADSLDATKVRMRDIAIRLRQRGQREAFLDPLKALARAVLNTHATRAPSIEPPALPWKPIATAPRDGNTVLVASFGGPAEEASWIDHRIARYSGWYGTGHQPVDNAPLTPDVWIDLPVAPKALAA